MVQQMTGYPSIDKPWMRYYNEAAICSELPECTVYDYLWENNKENLKDVALVYFHRKIDYRTLFNNILKAEKAFRINGIGNGDIVVLATVAIPETVYAFYALSKIGAIAEIIDPRLSPEEMRSCATYAKAFCCIEAAVPNAIKAIEGTGIQHVICMSPAESLPSLKKIAYRIGNKRTKSRLVISWSDYINNSSDAAEMNRAVSPNSASLITHTSGTTGKSKGVMLSHNNVNAVAFQYSLGMEHDRGQRYLNVIPPFIAFGVCVAIHLPLSMGMSCILIPKFEVGKFYDCIRSYRPNHFTCTPSNLYTLSKDKRELDLTYFRVPSVGGDYISPIQEDAINSYLHMHGCPVELVKGYGMTEVSSSACTTMKNHNKKESIGFPLCKMTISVFEPGTENELTYNQQGELYFSGPNVMLGYFNDPISTDNILKTHSDGRRWIHSGDIGYMDNDGFIYVIDRLKRIIHLSNGYDLLPSIVERSIILIQQVEACAVVGYVDTDGLVRVKAYIVSREKLEVKEIIEYCRINLPADIIPAAIEFIDKLPLTPVGKVDYSTLEQMANNKNTQTNAEVK